MSYGVAAFAAIICTAAIEMNAKPRTTPVSSEMLNCLKLRWSQLNCRFSHRISAGGGACLTLSRCFLRSLRSTGRHSHAKIPGRYMSNILRKSASSWNVTYAQMARFASPPRSF